MTTINRQFTAPKGTTINLVITIENACVSGSATFNGATYSITNYTIVKGRKALVLTGGSAPPPPDPGQHLHGNQRHLRQAKRAAPGQ